MSAEEQAGSFEMAVDGGGSLGVVVIAVDPALGVALGCSALPRPGSNSCPPCSRCQVGAERRVPDAAEKQIVWAVASFAGTGYLWAAPGDFLPAAGMDPGRLRPALSRRASGTTIRDVGARATSGRRPVLGSRGCEARFCGLTGACSGRCSSVPWPPRPCGRGRRLQCDCAATVSWALGRRRAGAMRAGTRRGLAARGLLARAAEGPVAAGSFGAPGPGRSVRSACGLHFAGARVRCIDCAPSWAGSVAAAAAAVVAQRTAAGCGALLGGRLKAGIAGRRRGH